MAIYDENVAFLQRAKESLRQLNAVKEERNRLEVDSKRLEKALREEKKAVNDAVKTTIKKRQDELNASYDKEIAKQSEKIKKEKFRRDKALAAQKKTRMKNETEGLRQQIQQYNSDARELYQREKMPAFCNSAFYYCIFSPKAMSELGVLLGTILVLFLVIPFIIYFLIPQKGVLPMVLIYLVDIVIFGGLYIFVNEKTKMSHPQAVQQGRKYRDAVLDAKKKIREIEENIQKDENESCYELEEFDAVLTELKDQLDTLNAQKEEALDNFERVTRKNIITEIQNNSREKIEQLEADLEQAREGFKKYDADSRELGLAFTENYGTYIDKAFLQEEKLDKLIEILQNEEASSITEAQNICKMR